MSCRIMEDSDSVSDSEDSDQSVYKTPLNSMWCHWQISVCMEEQKIVHSAWYSFPNAELSLHNLSTFG